MSISNDEKWYRSIHILYTLQIWDSKRIPFVFSSALRMEAMGVQRDSELSQLHERCEELEAERVLLMVSYIHPLTTQPFHF